MRRDGPQETEIRSDYVAPCSRVGVATGTCWSSSASQSGGRHERGVSGIDGRCRAQ